jgi:single-stranded DNA-binding protein
MKMNTKNNYIRLKGNLADIPSFNIKIPDSEVTITSFRIGVDTYKSSGTKETDWFNINFIGKDHLHILEDLIKGSLVIVEGRVRIQNKDFEGQPKTYFDIQGKTIKHLYEDSNNELFKVHRTRDDNHRRSFSTSRNKSS